MPKARKKTAFVPSVVFGTVVVGVVPACVVSACGGTTLAPADASSDVSNDMITADVAATCFGPNSPSCPPCCGVAAVAYMGFDASDATDAADDAPTDSPADSLQQDVLLGVAVCGFCDGGDEGGG